MIYTRINIMLPTFGRSTTKLPTFIRSMLETARAPDELRVTAVCNRRDLPSAELLRRFLGPRVCILWENRARPHLALFFNQAYGETQFRDPATCVSMFGDDMIFETGGWDQAYLDAINAEDGWCLVHGDDCTGWWGDRLAVHFVTTRQLVDAQAPAPFMHEGFPCDGIDVVWTEVARRCGMKRYLPHVKIRHNHAVFDGAQGRSDTVWMRLRSGLPEARQAAKGEYEYAEACAVRIREAVGRYRRPARPCQSGDTALLWCFGRMGDCVLASWISHALAELGLAVTYVTLPKYEALVRALCPGLTVLGHGDPALGWVELHESQLKQTFPGFAYYVNAQPGSSTHHDRYIGSGRHIADYMRETVSAVLGCEIGDVKNTTRYRRTKYAVDEARFANLPTERLAIICPRGISGHGTMPGDVLHALHADLERQGYHCRILEETASPEDGRYISGFTSVECLEIIRRSVLFIGADSGPAWLSMYSDCRKQIRHNPTRIDRGGVRFAAMDPKAEDVLA